MLSTALYLILDLFERYAFEKPASYWTDFQLSFLLPIQKLYPSYQNKHPVNDDLSPNYQPLCFFYSHLHPYKSMYDNSEVFKHISTWNKSLNKELGRKHTLLLPLQEVPKQHNIGQPEGQTGSSRMESLWGKFNMTLMKVFCRCFCWDYLRYGT